MRYFMIISASRRTDIPSYYFDWFLKGLKRGYFISQNPMNPKQIRKVYTDMDSVDCFVFWTKNPIPALDKLYKLKDYTYYFHYTLNDYPETLESNLPPLKERIEAFKILSEMTSKERVIWRYDPIIITDELSDSEHLRKFENIASQLAGYTDRVIISFLDLYRKNKKALQDFGLKDLNSDDRGRLVNGLKAIADKYQLEIKACCEAGLEEHGLSPSACIDGQLIEKILKRPINIKKDLNQRGACRCVKSVDIGAYNSCLNGCLYCYANYSKKTIEKNVSKHLISSPLLIGSLKDDLGIK